jgi:hypothetical protein
LIKWAGFTETHNSYEPEENILHPDLIDEFNRGKLPKGVCGPVRVCEVQIQRLRVTHEP